MTIRVDIFSNNLIEIILIIMDLGESCERARKLELELGLGLELES